MKVVRCSAPVRLDFAGAWTDVGIFADTEGGAVVNAAIGLRAHVEIQLGGERYFLRSEDLDDQQDVETPEQFARDGRLDLLKAALRMNDPGPCRLRSWSDAPPGSGLGTSGALDVALVGALDAARGLHRSASEVAEAAYHLEAIEAQHAGGKQDQYAAAFGGFNHLTFGRNGVAVTPLALDADFVAELARSIVICYTGQSRVSGQTISRVMSAYLRQESTVVDALRSLRSIAAQMADALRSANLPMVARLLDENWLQQQRLDPAMRTIEMGQLESAVRDAGALGGKAAGAGAGGSMFFVVRDPARATSAAQSCGARVLPLQWDTQGISVE